jgi:hypothetical protein
MGMRFQVLINGRSVCIAGIDGDGVLSVCLDRTQRPGKDERLALHVGGLGRYHPQLEKNSHVRWSVPEEMKPGDELAIRILAVGEYDDPLEVRPSPSAEIEDPVFGPLSYNVSAWDGQVPFEFPPARTTHVRVHLRAPESGPTPGQRDVFREFLSRYAELWPSIASALGRCHRPMLSIDAVARHVHPVIWLSLYEPEPEQVELSYRFDLDAEPRRSYHVTIRDWQVVEICSVE